MDYVIRVFSLTLLTSLIMGILWNLNRSLPRFKGDIYLDKLGFTIYIPFTSALIISAILLFLFNFFRF